MKHHAYLILTQRSILPKGNDKRFEKEFKNQHIRMRN